MGKNIPAVSIVGWLIYSSVAPAGEQTYPAFRIEQVVQRANLFLKEDQNRDLLKSRCYIQKVEFREIGGSRRESYWTIWWAAPDKGAKWNCVAEMRMFNDGSIIRVVGY